MTGSSDVGEVSYQIPTAQITAATGIPETGVHTWQMTAPGTDEGDTIATIGVAVSSIVMTLVIALGVILLVPLRPVLTSPVVQTATKYLPPALFGGIFLSFVNDDYGEYVAKGKCLSMIVPVALVFIVNMFFPFDRERRICGTVLHGSDVPVCAGTL